MVGVGASQQQKRRSSNGSEDAVVAGLYRDLDAVTGRLGELSPETITGFAQQGQRIFQAIELEALAAMRKAGATENDTRRRAAAGGTRSRSAASKTKKRADTVDANPDLADDVRTGELGEEHLDALATASEKSGGDAARDETLIGELKDSTPDDANNVTQKWLERRDNSTESRYDRQRGNRGVSFGYDKATGCDTVTGRGDSETIRELKKQIAARANDMYKADGGRDLPAAEHPRTHQQRMFDALCELLGTHTDTGNDTSAPRAPHPKAMVHVLVTVDEDDESLVRAAALDGNGYLPQSVLDKYGCSSIIAGTVFNAKGEALWHGRQKRHATPAQFSALIARDHGCVLCGADPSRCEAHHLMPWHAPAKGKTNIDELALVCTGCHHWLHDNKRTLIWQHAPPDRGSPPDELRPTDTKQPGKSPSRTWTTRPATPQESAPTKPIRAHAA